MIRLKNISYTYPAGKENGGAVKDVNLTISAGEFVVLCGRSGCGKTTLTRLINGLIPHFYEGELEGEVIVDGVRIRETELSETASLIGSVFQNPKSQFFNVDTTGELAFGCENQALGREEILRRIENTKRAFQLENLMDRSIFELSGGEKQQIACGSIYAAGPQVYVLDEPSSSMDIRAIRRLEGILKKLKEDGRTVVISEHRLYYLMDLADRFVYMENGRITASFTPSQLRAMGSEQREKLGLRAVSISEISYGTKKAETAQKAGGPEETAALGLRNLKCLRGKKEVLDIESLEIPSGSITAVIGENGAGKTTLAECIAGLQKCRGKIFVKGRQMSAQERTFRSYMVMQDVNHQLFCESVEEEVSMGLTGQNREKVPECLMRMGLAAFKDRHPASLSGGQKQRVAICGAVCAGKELLIYDEPTSGLDYDSMNRLCGLIQETAANQPAVMIITHDPELIAGCCTHVLHMENGRAKDFYPLDEAGGRKVKTFFMEEGKKTVSEKKEKKKTGMARMLELAGRKKQFTIPSVILSILASAASFVPHLCIYGIVMEITGNYPGMSESGRQTIIALGLLAFGGVAANIACYYGALVLSHLAAFGTLYELKIDFTKHLARLPLGFHLCYGSGKLRKITDENIEKIEGFIAHQLPDLAAALAAPVIMIVILLAVDWRYGLVSLFGIVIAYAVEIIAYGGPEAKVMMNQYQNALEDMNNASVEYVRGITVVKAFRQTVYSFNRLHDSIKNYTSFVIPYTMGWRNYMSAYTTIVNNIYLLIIPTAICIGMRTPAEGYAGYAATAIFYLLFVPSIASVMMKVMYSSNNCRQISSCVERMDEVLDTPPLAEPEAPKHCTPKDVVFENVSFSYDADQEVQALKHVSFCAKQGQVTAIVGPSGGGKSTIASLIPRFYDVTEGCIRIGGTDIRDVKTEELMSVVSFVFQDVFLFKQSLMENIRMGRPDATEADVIAAAKAARCHEAIMALPKGYDTVYGRDGVYLSGGEQQRVAIARAIVKNAPILVLDEATAFADPENEHLIQQALKELMKGKTVIMIAHRLSTVKSAGQILVMQDGELIESGSHETLLEENGRYRKMWDTYTKTLSWRMEKGGRESA